MRKVEFIPLILTDVTDIFTIRFNGEQLPEYHKFLVMFKDTPNPYLADDLARINKAIELMAKNGALDNFFRPEGRLNDRVCAIPLLIQSRDKSVGTLRLYCIRISDQLLIIGGGGLKTTATYEENPDLLKKVKDLQVIDFKLKEIENSSPIRIEDAIYNLVINID